MGLVDKGGKCMKNNNPFSDPNKDWDYSIDNIMRKSTRYILKLLIMVFIVMAVCIIRYKITESTKEPIKTGCYWKNIDPSLPYNRISDLDYVNGTVTYTPHAYPGQFESTHSTNNYNGVTLKAGDVTINTGLSSEEIIQQLDVDYNDIYDYYGIELR